MNAPTEMPDIPKALQRVSLVYTYTNLNCYIICPHQMYRRYVVKDLPFVETKEMKHGNDAHAAFEKRIGASAPLPEQFRQWEHFAAPLDGLNGKVEMKLGVLRNGKPVDYWSKSVFLRGKLDYALVRPTQAQLFDWKTGKTREDPFELEIGAMLLKMNAPHITTIFGNYVWLRDDRMGQRHDLSDTEATTRKVAALVRAIESDMKFEKTPGPLCGWCNVYDCEHNKNQNRP